VGNISLKRRIPSAILLTTSRPTTARAVPARSPVRPARSAALLLVPLPARSPATPAAPAPPGVTVRCWERGRTGPKRDKDRGHGRGEGRGGRDAGGRTGQQGTHDTHPPRAARRRQREGNSDGRPTGRGQRAQSAAQAPTFAHVAA
jgi:hypothetical protein